MCGYIGTYLQTNVYSFYEMAKTWETYEKPPNSQNFNTYELKLHFQYIHHVPFYLLFL